MRTIDADELMKSFVTKAQDIKDKHGVAVGECWVLDYDDIKDVIEKAPTVEPPKMIAKIKTTEQADNFTKAWERANHNGLLIAIDDVDFVPIQKTASWKWQAYTNGFGTFKELCCGECYHKRQQIDLHFCACCGAKMTNADELGGTT